MAYVPPWLNVQPSDFVQAAAAGAKIGTQMAELATSARLKREALRSSERENAARLANQQALAGAHAAAAAQQNEAERRMRLFEERNRIQLARDQLASQDARAAEALKATTAYREGVLAARGEANEIAQQRADIYAMRGPAGAGVARMDPLDSHLLQDALVRRRSAQSDMAEAASSTVMGGDIPQVVMDRLKAANDDIEAISKKYMQPALKEGQRVRNKQTGQTGTVVNGEIVPDEEEEELSFESQVPALENPYAGMGLPVRQGFLYLGENAEVPAK